MYIVNKRGQVGMLQTAFQTESARALITNT